jgi:hypothetical protein
MALWCNSNVDMDSLSLKFAEESAIRQVDDCQDLAELKRLTKLLIQGHFQSRDLIATLMRQSLDEMTRSVFRSEPPRSCPGQAPAN